MSEYRDAHTASRLIGAPPGYVGHEDGGTLTTAVKHRPYALLLFESIEYAHPDVLRLLSQILGRGSLTDSRGTTVSFRHTILIMTSAHTAAPPTVGFHTGSADDTSPDIQWLPKDLLCRIDAVVRFHPLSEDSAHKILASRLSLLADRLSARGITFSFDDAALPVLYRQTTKPRGAADLIRTVSEQVESPIARALSDGTLAEHDICTLAADNDTLRLHMQHSQP